MTKRTPLIHRTCEHSAAGIHAGNLVVQPSAAHFTDLPVSWWSDLTGAGDAIRRALGLTSTLLVCDRMTHAFVAVSTDGLVRYASPEGRALVPDRGIRRMLEDTPGAMPAHWWMASAPVAVLELMGAPMPLPR
jgi:hypothetical protein